VLANEPPAGTPGYSSLFKAAFTHSRIPMGLVDANRNIIDVNGACLRLLGYTRDQLVGQPLHSFGVGTASMSVSQWQVTLARHRFAGEGKVRDAAGQIIAVQWAATSELVTGRYLALLVILTSSRRGSRPRRPASRASQSVPLSPREVEIVALVALGRSGPEIADELSISPQTVRTHVRNAKEKLDARSRAQLVAKALAEGMILNEELANTLAPLDPAT
jgi:PAS domain S-box-containing protein